VSEHEQALRRIAAECYPLATHGDPCEYVTHLAQRVLAAVPADLLPATSAALPQGEL
jgi:hypothetical protein